MSENPLDGKRREIKDLLNEAWDMARNKALRGKLESASQALDDLCDLWNENMDILEAELKSEKEEFEFRFRQLRGVTEKFRALAAKSPESPCGNFKAMQVNQVLAPMKALMEPTMKTDFPLVSEEKGNTYSDVSLLLQLVMDVAAAFAKHQYDISYDFRGEKLAPYRFGYGRR